MHHERAQEWTGRVRLAVILFQQKLDRLWLLTFCSCAAGSSMAKLRGGLALPAALAPLRGTAIGSVRRQFCGRGRRIVSKRYYSLARLIG